METLPRVFDRCCSVGGESGYGSQTDITSIFTNNAFTNSTVNVIGRNGSITNLNEVDQSEFDALRAEAAAASAWRLNVEKFHTILCGGCNAEVANIRDAFRMPGHSRCATPFVNPYGYAHTTVTVTKLSDCVAYRIEGQATTQHTWFPGYSWIILRCVHCGDHLGWKFEAVADDKKPEVFFGCTLRSCKLQ